MNSGEYIILDDIRFDLDTPLIFSIYYAKYNVHEWFIEFGVKSTSNYLTISFIDCENMFIPVDYGIEKYYFTNTQKDWLYLYEHTFYGNKNLHYFFHSLELIISTTTDYNYLIVGGKGKMNLDNCFENPRLMDYDFNAKCLFGGTTLNNSDVPPLGFEK